MKKIDVTFIIIAYNEEKSISSCIKSIFKQNAEFSKSIIVVNDGSTDKTSKVVEELALQYPGISLLTNTPNKGRGFSRKLGVSKAHSDYIAFVDSDIILPENWLEICFKELTAYDAVGGIAVPDGDVQFVFTKYGLKPKITIHTVEVTGSNGLFKKSIFEKINFAESMKNGEDVDFMWRVKNNGFKVKNIPNLISIHKEHKNFQQSLVWLFQSGVGASKLFRNFKKVRLPDLVFFAWIIITLVSVVLSFSLSNFFFILPLLFSVVVSCLHLNSKFKLLFSMSSIKAILVNSVLIDAYLLGRLIGTFKEV